jgi:hypothetical protein
MVFYSSHFISFKWEVDGDAIIKNNGPVRFKASLSSDPPSILQDQKTCFNSRLRILLGDFSDGPVHIIKPFTWENDNLIVEYEWQPSSLLQPGQVVPFQLELLLKDEVIDFSDTIISL